MTSPFVHHHPSSLPRDACGQNRHLFAMHLCQYVQFFLTTHYCPHMASSIDSLKSQIAGICVSLVLWINGMAYLKAVLGWIPCGLQCRRGSRGKRIGPDKTAGHWSAQGGREHADQGCCRAEVCISVQCMCTHANQLLSNSQCLKERMSRVRLHLLFMALLISMVDVNADKIEGRKWTRYKLAH